LFFPYHKPFPCGALEIPANKVLAETGLPNAFILKPEVGLLAFGLRG
jgi:hypothetical protein